MTYNSDLIKRDEAVNFGPLRMCQDAVLPCSHKAYYLFGLISLELWNWGLQNARDHSVPLTWEYWTHSKRISPLFLRWLISSKTKRLWNQSIRKGHTSLTGNVPIPSFRAAQKLPFFEAATGEEQVQSSLPQRTGVNWVTSMLGFNYFMSCQLPLSALWNKQAVQKASWNVYWIPFLVQVCVQTCGQCGQHLIDI